MIEEKLSSAGRTSQEEHAKLSVLFEKLDEKVTSQISQLASKQDIQDLCGDIGSTLAELDKELAKVQGSVAENGAAIALSKLDVIELLETRATEERVASTAEINSVLKELERLRDSESEARRALVTQIGDMKKNGSELLNAETLPMKNAADWLAEAKYVLYGLNLLRQDGYLRDYSKAQEDFAAARKRFLRTGKLEHFDHAVTIVKAVHRLASARQVPPR